MRHVPGLRQRRTERVGGRQGFSSGNDELGDVAKPSVVAGVGRAGAEQLSRHEQCGLRVWRPAAAEGRRGHGSANIGLHRGVHGGVLLLEGSGVGGSSGRGIGRVLAGHHGTQAPSERRELPGAWHALDERQPWYWSSGS